MQNINKEMSGDSYNRIIKKQAVFLSRLEKSPNELHIYDHIFLFFYYSICKCIYTIPLLNYFNLNVATNIIVQCIKKDQYIFFIHLFEKHEIHIYIYTYIKRSSVKFYTVFYFFLTIMLIETLKEEKVYSLYATIFVSKELIEYRSI